MVKFHTKESEYIRRLEESNKGLRKEIEKLKERERFEEICKRYDFVLKENKSLKEELKDFNNLIGRLERTEELNRKLKEELSKLKEKYWDLDF